MKYYIVSLVLMLVLLPSIVTATDYYVDNSLSTNGNGLSWTTAWNSFGAIQWGSISGGDSIYISGGSSQKTYSEVLDIEASGSPGNPVTVRVGQTSPHDGKVIIEDSNDAYGIGVFGQSYVTISGQIGSGNEKNIVVRGHSNDEIRLNSITGVIMEYLEVGPNTNDECILVEEYITSGNIIRHCDIHDCYDYGILVARPDGDANAGITNDEHLIIENNEIYNLGHDAIHAAGYAGGLTIRRNHIHTQLEGVNYHPSYVDGMHLRGFIHLTVESNEIHDLWSGDGVNGYLYLECDSVQSNEDCHDIRVNNNVIYETDHTTNSDQNSRGIQFAPKYCSSLSNVEISSNTIVDTRVWGIMASDWSQIPSSEMSNVRIFNNIIYNNDQRSGGTSDRISFVFHDLHSTVTTGSFGDTPTPDIIWDYNLVDALNAQAICRYGTGDPGTLMDYSQFNSASGCDDHGVEADPIFLSYSENAVDDASDLQLASSDTAARDSGTASSQYSVDFAGVTRAVPWDIGAYELTQGGIHISQSGSGSQDGSNEANSRSILWFNDQGNWGSGSGEIGPGDTVYFHWTITTTVQIRGSGLSSERITLDFSDATMNAGGTQIDLNGNDHLTITNANFDSSISSGYLIDFDGNSEFITISNSHYNGPSTSTVKAIHHRYGSNTIIENNEFINVANGVWGTEASNHDITIRNNKIWGSTGANTGEQDIIKLGDTSNVLIEGNYLAIRKANQGGSSDNHCDVIQTFRGGGGNPGNPSNWIIRYNLLELNTDSAYHRSWTMLEAMEGEYHIYSNVFLGTQGGQNANGLAISRAASSNFKAYIHGNTFIAKDGPGNTLAIQGSGTYYYSNNILMYGSIKSPAASNFIRSNNIYYQGSHYSGSSCSEWISDESNSHCDDPGFIDYDNDDFRLTSGSIARDSGTNLGSPYDNALNSAVFPNPNMISRPQGAQWDIGAYEYADGGSSSCSGTDTSCGVWPSCDNCNSDDGCYGTDERDYSCSGTSCTYSSEDCSVTCLCTCGGYGVSESSSSGNCGDYLDNDCDGDTDTADSGCGTTSCLTSTLSWQSTQFAQQFETFTVQFDATPLQDNMDGGITLALSVISGWSDNAVIVRFNTNGEMDARNGPDYGADTQMSYSMNTVYHFRIDVNIPDHTYSVYVTPQGGSEQTLATDYAFRSDQSTATDLNYWGLIADAGTQEVCDFQVGSSGQQTYHRADNNPSDCIIDINELIVFMNRWRVSIADVGMPEMMDAIERWKSGIGCS